MCKRSLAIPGFGPLVSQAIKNWMGDGKQFRRGRDASAALGLVPRLFSTGGKQVLLGITKCGSDSNLLIVFYVQIMPDDLVMQLHRF
ncbi:IS110 family transposase [Escherichia coli]